MKKYTEITLRIDWSEMDLFGHVNNVMYFKYVQAARVSFWEKAQLDKYQTSKNYAPILASTNCIFLKPLHFPGNVIIKTSIEFIKNTSIGLQHFLYNDAGEKVAESNDILVYYDFTNHSKTPLPEDIKDVLKGMES